MNFSEIFIRRPVLSTVVGLMILLVGAQSILNLSIRQYPEVEETVITITTIYPGASGSLIQGFITTPIAKSVSTAEGIDFVKSTSTLGTSTVTVQMQLNANPDVALSEVTAKVQEVRSQLPSDAEDPVIQKGTGQQFAMMYLSVQSEQMNARQLTEYLTRVVQPRMATIDGVADAQILGAANFAMRVWIDPVRLASRGVTAAEVLAAIRGANFLSAPGKTENQFVAYQIEMQTTLQTPEAFGALPLRADGDEVVRLRDVADIELGSENDDVRVSFDGRQGVFIGVFPTPTANPLTTAEAVRTELPLIQADLPAGMQIAVLYDSTAFIEASIVEVFKTIAEAAGIVMLIIFLFLGSFRAVSIPIVTIPLSLIGVCMFLLALDYSLNTLTLLAMVLAIGLVVDDAIVVVENIHRHIEEGKTPFDASLIGMREIFAPVVAMTITLAAVFAPLAFVQGLTGSLFAEFAVALAGAVIISGFVAVTISPMMSARLLKPGGGRLAHFIDRNFERLSSRYARLLAGSLKYRPVTLMIVVAILGTSGYLFTKTTTELAPEEDQGALFSVINAPRYATADYTQLYADQFNQLTEGVEGVDTRFQVIGFGGSNAAFSVWALKPWDDREMTQAEIQQDIQGRIGKAAGVEAFVFAPPSLPGSGGGLPVQYVVQSTGSPEQVFDVSETIKQRAEESGRFIVVQNSMSYDTPQVRMLIDRSRSAALGVPISEIGATLGALVGNAPISQFDRDSRSYDVIAQVPQAYRENPERLRDLFVRSATGSMVPLSALVTIETGAAPATLEQFNQLNSATISALPLPGVSTGDALATLRQIGAEAMPEGFFENFAGQSRLEVQQGNTILLAFGLAVVVIYLVLAAQFESFRDPLIIMMSVPLSIFGALIPLNLGLGTLNIFTQIGLITLVGLITKHGILMVQFGNQQRMLGLDRREAIIEAARVRLRPILMTTAAMVLGVVPLILATGAGAAARYSLGLVIASGMAVGTLFTLFVVPMFYTYLAGEHGAKAELAAATPPALPAPAE